MMVTRVMMVMMAVIMLLVTPVMVAMVTIIRLSVVELQCRSPEEKVDDIEEEEVEKKFPTNVCGKRSHPPTFQSEPR